MSQEKVRNTCQHYKQLQNDKYSNRRDKWLTCVCDFAYSNSKTPWVPCPNKVYNGPIPTEDKILKIRPVWKNIKQKLNIEKSFTNNTSTNKQKQNSKLKISFNLQDINLETENKAFENDKIRKITEDDQDEPSQKRCKEITPNKNQQKPHNQLSNIIRYSEKDSLLSLLDMNTPLPSSDLCCPGCPRLLILPDMSIMITNPDFPPPGYPRVQFRETAFDKVDFNK